MTAPSGPSWRGLVVLVAGATWDGNRGTEQHLALGLSRHAPVLYVDPQRSVAAPPLPGGHRWGRLVEVAPRLAVLTPPVLPGHTRAGIRHSTTFLRRRAMAWAARRLGGDVAAVVAATLDDVFGACGERRRVVYATDDFVAGAELMGLPAERLRRSEAARAREADVLVAVSEEAGARWRAAGFHVHVLPNGCDVDHFAGTDDAPLPPDVDLPHPIAGVVGHLNPRIDARLLAAVADAGTSVLLVGPAPAHLDLDDLRAVLDRPNVAWVGPRPYDALPSYLRVIDVGLVPYVDDAFNRASFPLKTLEYLAAGRPVVATDLPAIRALATPEVRLATGPEEFAVAVRQAAATPRDAAAVARRRAVAAAQSWDRRVDELAGWLDLDPGAGSSTPDRPGVAGSR